MKRIIFSLAILLGGVILLSGCSSLQRPAFSNQSETQEDFQSMFDDEVDSLGNDLQKNSDELVLKNQLQEKVAVAAAEDYYYPIQNYQENATRKSFGQFIPNDGNDRFSGYHTGDDIEVTDITVEVPVYAITDARITTKEFVSGYGGVLILEFQDADEEIYHAIYGHLDLTSIAHEIGDVVVKGEVLGNLGDHQSIETDGERKHLHFGLYQYASTELFAGYVQDDADLAAWINPADFLRNHYAKDPEVDLENDISNAINGIVNPVD